MPGGLPLIRDHCVSSTTTTKKFKNCLEKEKPLPRILNVEQSNDSVKHRKLYEGKHSCGTPKELENHYSDDKNDDVGDINDVTLPVEPEIKPKLEIKFDLKSEDETIEQMEKSKSDLDITENLTPEDKSITLPEDDDNNNGGVVNLNESELSWMAGLMPLGAAAASVPVPLIMKYFGRKLTLLSVVPFYTGGFFLLAWSRNVNTQIFLFFLSNFISARNFTANKFD